MGGTSSVPVPVPAHAQEIIAKLASVLGTSSVAVRNTPRQVDGFDCGVYVLAIAEWICANELGPVAAAAAAGMAGGDGTALTDLCAVDAFSPAAVSAKRAAIYAVVTSLVESAGQ